MNDVARAFERNMLDDSREYTRVTKTSPSRYLQMINDNGGVETARRLAIHPKFHEGFTRAWEHGCLELTAEYLMAYGRDRSYRSLFDDATLASAERKLKQVGVEPKPS